MNEERFRKQAEQHIDDCFLELFDEKRMNSEYRQGLNDGALIGVVLSYLRLGIINNQEEDFLFKASNEARRIKK